MGEGDLALNKEAGWGGSETGNWMAPVTTTAVGQRENVWGIPSGYGDNILLTSSSLSPHSDITT